MLRVCSLLWPPNEHSKHFSRCYNESWVEKLYRGFRRNLTRPFRFDCFVDQYRVFSEPIEQHLIASNPLTYGACIEPYALNEPMILVGLDTVVTGNIDHLADYCLTETDIALPRDPYRPEITCNGVALVPAGHRAVYADWRGQNDMDWMRARQDVQIIDDLWPAHVVSYKGHAQAHGLGDARIVYFHGLQKPHELPHVPWVAEHWC